MRAPNTGHRRAKLLSVVSLLGTATACFDVEKVDPTIDGVVLAPDTQGWIRRDTNPIGVQGAWYTYGDRYGDPAHGGSKCTEVGLHDVEECSKITYPKPEEPRFPNVGGRMCTQGETAIIPLCKPLVPNCASGQYDYTNVWGAGIGLDFNTEQNRPYEKSPYDAPAAGVLGVSFEIDIVFADGVRVEFPILLPQDNAYATTEDHPDGSPYWGAGSNGGYHPSPIVRGYNRFHWSDVGSPVPGDYAFDPTKILAIQFHVPAVDEEEKLDDRRPFSFCVSNLTLLRE